MKGSDTVKKLITVAVLLAVLGWAVYYLFFKPQEVAVVLDEFGNPTRAQVIGSDLINLLEELKSVSFDSSFFKSPVFLSLFDYSIDLGAQPQGRRNPFETIGRGGTTQR